jgi:hypothetical protein
LSGNGLQQVEDYEIVGSKFVYTISGHGNVEFDCFTEKGTLRDNFPTPRRFWMWFQAVRAINDYPTSLRFLTLSLHEVTDFGQR